MPDVINPAGLTWCGQLADEVIIKPVFQTPEMERFFDIMVGVVSKRQMVLDEILENVLQESTGCGRDVTGQVIDLTEKFIEVCDAKINLDQCAKGLDATMFEEWRKSGNALFDLTSTRIADYIIEKVQQAMRLDLFKVVWFGDTTSTDQVLSICDGLWKRLINAAQTYDMISFPVGDGTLGDCAALDLMREMYDGASDLLDQIPENQKYFALTRSLYSNYLACREDACCGDRSWEMIEEGARALTFRGIPVYKVAEWDRIIAAKGLSNPHRAIYTYNKNLVVGTDNMADTNSLEILYNPYEKTNQVDAEFKIATNYKYDELTVIAY